MKRALFTTILYTIFHLTVNAQIINGLDTLYGNEWIDFDKSYFKIMVAEDGIYRLGKQDLLGAGMPIDQMTGDQLQMFHNGEEIPLYTSTNAIFSDSDYLEFYGEKNRSELDRHLYANPDEEMMNPYYSLFTDTSAYFLTWTTFGIPKRYEEIENDLTNLPPKQEYYMAELVQEYHNAWAKEQNGQGVSLSNFTMSEGYSSSFTNSQEFNIMPIAPFVSGPPSKLHIRYSGNLKNHQQLITLNNQDLTTDEFYGYEVRQLEFDVNNGLLTSPLNLKFQGLTDGSDRQRIGYLKLEYPRMFDFEGKDFHHFTLTASNAKQYFEINNFNGGGGTILYDVNNGQRVETVVENSLVKFSLPAHVNSREIVLINTSSGVKTPLIQPINFIDYGAIDANFIFLSNPKLYDDGNGNNYVQDYADYRSSNDGGSFETIIVDIQQVYDQFGWGLNRHSLSIRNFSHYVKKNWTDPQYFFIVGKGREYNSQRTAVSDNMFVPTFGVPGSDNQLLAGSDGFTPVIPIGRIAAQSTDNIRVYFKKLKEFEGNKNLPQTIEDRAWMKRVLHLGGGNGAILSEQILIRSYLENMAEILMDGKMGATTRGFYKTSTDPIQQPQTDEIFDYLNSGVSLITFFGHSSVGVFDFSIDFPDNWNNKGKYPWMVSLGCYAGNIHTGSTGIGERFLFLEDAGSIAFTATAGQGYISSLNTFTSDLYGELGSDYYDKGIGTILQKSISNFTNNNFGVNLIRQQFNLLGDPSLKLNTTVGADFLVDPATVNFDPEQVNANQAKFNLSFDVVNIGENIKDSIQIEIEHKLPDASRIIVIDSLVPTPPNRSEFKFEIPVPGKSSIGLNKFFIKLDSRDNVEELPLPEAELNNELIMQNGEKGATLFIRDNSAVPVYPPEFGIAGPDVTLKATSTDPLAPERKYLLQIDTTEVFNSNLFLSTEIVQSGGVIRWEPSVDWKDETVYYWRISPDSVSLQEGYSWNNSSFLYKDDGTHGWNQSHYYQFLKDEMVNIELEGHDSWDFLDNFKDMTAKNRPGNIAITLNNAGRGQYWGGNASAYILWMDSVYAEPKINAHPAQFGLNHPWSINSATYFFDIATSTGRKELMDFLNEEVGAGDYILFLTVLKNTNTDFNTEEWAADSLIYGENLFQTFEDRGAEKIRQLETLGSVPYIIGFKNNGNILAEDVGILTNDTAEVAFSIEGNWDKGQIKTPLIGPASKWNTLKWDVESINHPETDTVFVEIYGISKTGEESLLSSHSFNDPIDLSNINSIEFPFLKLKMLSKDSLFRTTANLNRWRIIYEGVPEFTFSSSNEFNLENDTIQAGEPLILSYNVENLSVEDGDSLLVKYTFTDNSNNQLSFNQRLSVISTDVSEEVKINFSTNNFIGKENLLIELNPDDDQLEQTHVNNFLHTDFFVEGDIRNPILDVTFDGAQIMNGEIVSPEPIIRISLKDENPYFLLDDTSRIELYVLYPENIQPTQISLSGQNVNFYPATSQDDNLATIEYKPEFEIDGEYTIIIQARDVAGNLAGAYDFKRDFRVITKSSISNFINYPNPFSTSTRFLYTLTGSEIPTKYKLQIMTISGTIVREVNKQEIGRLVPGTHLTDFVWDGRDEFGDKLANGVYLYRLVVLNEDNKEWEKFETGADSYFKNETGKMVLIR